MLEVVFIPSEIRHDQAPVCVLVDAIRASGTTVTFFDKGCSQVLLTSDEKKSLEIDKKIIEESYCICAERVEGDKAELAHVSPSIGEINALDSLNDRKVLFRTTNGTLGVHNLQKLGIDEIYIGTMLNRDAVMKAALNRAKELSTGVSIVCAGRGNGTIYCIDDTYCSGKLVESSLNIADEMGIELNVQDSAKIALNMLNSYKNTVDAFEKSATGQIMRNVHTEIDIILCAQDNISSAVPKVSGVDKYGHIIIDKVNI